MCQVWAVNREKKARVCAVFHKILFGKQAMHDNNIPSFEGTWQYLSCWLDFSFRMTYKFIKYVKNFSTLTSPKEIMSLSKFKERSQLKSELEKTFHFSTIHFISTLQNILGFVLVQLVRKTSWYLEYKHMASESPFFELDLYWARIAEFSK